MDASAADRRNHQTGLGKIEIILIDRKRARDRRTRDIRVQDRDSVAFFGKCRRKQAGDKGFADAALTAHNGINMLNR